MNTEKAVSTGVNQFILAGWLSILQAAFIFLGDGVELYSKIMSLSITGYIQMILGFHVVGKLVGIYVLFMFRRLLIERHNFYMVDKLILVLIFCYATSALIGTAELVHIIPQYSFMTALPILFSLTSLISIVYAFRLLKLEGNLSGLLKPYVYTMIASGVCGVTIVLGQFGSIISMVSLILLGMILIRAESEPEYL